MSKWKSLWVALVAVVSFVVVASASASTLSDVVQGGLPANNAPKAMSVVKGRAAVDPNLQQNIANAAGDASYNAANLKVLGYSNGAPAGTSNSGESSNGTLTPTQNTKTCNIHSRMLVVLDVVTRRKVWFCIHCSNLRMWSSHPAWHRFVQQVRLNVNRKFTKRQKICNVWVTLTVRLHGVIKAKTWGQVLGALRARLAAAFRGKVTATLKAKCPKPSTPCNCGGTPPNQPCGCGSTPPPSSGNCNGNSYNGGTGSAGNCNTCTGNNNCTITITPPPCGSGCTPPPPPPPPAPPAGNITPWRNQEFYTDTQGNAVCVTTDITFTSVTVIPTYEKTTDGGVAQPMPSYGKNVWCDTTYEVGHEPPGSIWTPPAAPGDPPYSAGYYDTLHWEGVDKYGNTVKATGYVQIVQAATNYPQ